MQIGEWLEKLPFGDKSFGDKSVWVVMKGGGKLGDCKFAIPYSAMMPFDNGDVYRKVTKKNKDTGAQEKYVHYKMTKGSHRGCTWGGKKSDGTPRFKSTKYGTTSVQETRSGFKKGDVKLVKSNKQYYCKDCQGKVYIERDPEGNAYCVDCGKKMFG